MHGNSSEHCAVACNMDIDSRCSWVTSHKNSSSENELVFDEMIETEKGDEDEDPGLISIVIIHPNSAESLSCLSYSCPCKSLFFEECD